MQTMLIKTLAVATILSSLLLVSSGCSKKTVIPPPSSSSGTSLPTGANGLDYPMAEGMGFSQESLPIEGNLDDTQPADTAMQAGTDAAMNPDTQSDEYKRLHGRSSANLYSIYFNFDQAGIRPDMTDVLFGNAEYINSVPQAALVIEGNCDDRGTNEYNLALGERRALNTMQYLTNLGVDPRRMRTLSYGEEKPLFLGQGEEVYSKNRRVDFILQ